jgi:hypothetical protein
MHLENHGAALDWDRLETGDFHCYAFLPRALPAALSSEDFGNFVDVAQTIREVFEAEGWTEDEAAIADGPTGTATSYFKDTTVAAVNVSWEPSDEADCPADQPISDCDIEPSQQNFTISIELVQIA